jgi:tetratricopeptide (TPR) repeat protein
MSHEVTKMRMVSFILLASITTVSQQIISSKAAAVTRQEAIQFLTQAHALAASFPRPGERVSVMDDISIVLFQAGEARDSAAVVKEAIAAMHVVADQIGTTPPRQMGHTTIGSGEIQLAGRATRSAAAHSAAGDREGARAWLEFARQRAPNNSVETERVFSLGQIAKVQIEIGDLDGAAQAVRLIGGTSSIPIDRWSDLAAARVRGGDLNAAKEIASSQEGIAKSIVLRSISEALAETGDFPAATATADSIANLGFRIEALTHLAETQRRTGNEPAAKASFARAMKIAEQLPGGSHGIALAQARTDHFAEAIGILSSLPGGQHSVKPRAFVDVGVLAAKAKHPVVAAECFARALAAVEEAAKAPPDTRSRFEPASPGESEDWRWDYIQVIAVAQAESNNIAAGLKTANLLPEMWREGAMMQIASAQAKAGDIAGAEKTASGAPRRGIPYELVLAKARAGNFIEAFQIARGAPPELLEEVFRIHCMPGELAGCMDAASKLTNPRNRARALLGIAEALLGVARPAQPEQERTRAMQAVRAQGVK